MGGKRKTEQDYHNLAISQGFEWLGPMLKIQYKTWWRCPEGHEWDALFHNILKGSGCPYCAGNIPKKEQDYHDLVQSRNFKWIGKKIPKGIMYKTQWQCQDGHEWDAKFDGIRGGQGCPHCYGNARLTSRTYHDLAQARGFKWISKRLPKNTQIKTLWECSFGHKWSVRYADIYTGSGCPGCIKFKGPERIKEVLHSMGIGFETEKRFPSCKHKRPLPFDFFIPIAKLLIEYQGRQHFANVWGALSDVKRNDKIKAEWADRSPYELLCINYWQYDHIVEILVDRLLEE